MSKDYPTTISIDSKFEITLFRNRNGVIQSLQITEVKEDNRVWRAEFSISKLLSLGAATIYKYR